MTSSKENTEAKDVLKESSTEPTKELSNEISFLSEIDSIVDVRVFKGKKQYLVRWKDFKDDENQWISEDKLDCKPLLRKFLNKKNIEKRNQKKIDSIIEATFHDDQLYYEVKTFSGEKEEITSNYAHTWIPQNLISYLENLAKFESKDDSPSQP